MKFTPFCCFHYWFSGSITHTLGLLVAHIVSCNNPDHVSCHWFQATNQMRITPDTVLIGLYPWSKVAHFSVFNIVVEPISSSTVGERRVPMDFNCGITHWFCHSHISNCWRWGWRKKYRQHYLLSCAQIPLLWWGKGSGDHKLLVVPFSNVLIFEQAMT